MTKQGAKTISELMLEFGARLDRSLVQVKASETDADFKKYRDAVSKVMTVMLLEVMNPLYREHPDLKPEGLNVL